MDEILKMSREINYSNLVYDFKGTIPSINFTIFGGPMYTYNQLKNGEKTLQQVEEEHKYFEKDLNEIASGNPKHKSEKQAYTIKNVRNLYDLRQKKILIYLMITQKLDLKPFTNQNKIKQQEQDLKYYHQKKMLQRLPIALAQVKADNNSESLLNKIRQIVYSLYH